MLVEFNWYNMLGSSDVWDPVSCCHQFHTVLTFHGNSCHALHTGTDLCCGSLSVCLVSSSKTAHCAAKVSEGVYRQHTRVTNRGAGYTCCRRHSSSGWVVALKILHWRFTISKFVYDSLALHKSCQKFSVFGFLTDLNTVEIRELVRALPALQMAGCYG